MPKAQLDRRIFIEDARRGKYTPHEFQGIIKYKLNGKDRAYVLEKLPRVFYNYAYSLPKPEDYAEIGQYEVFINDVSSLTTEFSYLIEQLRIYRNEILKFLSIYKRLEPAIVSEDYEESIRLLDEVDSVGGCSVFTMMCEYFINEKRGDHEANNALIQHLLNNGSTIKLQITADFMRFRIDADFSSIQYTGALEQHIGLYDEKTNQRFIDYLNFKFDFFHYSSEIKAYPFILSFDSDFSIIDRYLSLKRWLPLFLSDKNVNDSDKKFVIDTCIGLFPTSPEPFWTNFKALYGSDSLPDIPDRSGFHFVQEMFFESNYAVVIDTCVARLNEHPHYSELYLPLVQSLLISNQSVSETTLRHQDVRETLSLMESILIKDSEYLNSREKLLKKFFTIAHFEYSIHILEFIYNEYHLYISSEVQIISLLNSAVFRYNAFKVFKDQSRMRNLLSHFKGQTERY